MSNNTIIRKTGVPINKNYEVGQNYPFDSRLAVDSTEALSYPANWFILVEDDFGDTTVNFIGFKGMPVSDISTGNLYIVRDYQIGATIDASTVEFDLIATQEWVEEQGYGTGSEGIDTTNLVTIDGTQTITGAKTFSSGINLDRSINLDGMSYTATVQETFLTSAENGVNAGAFTIKNNGKLYIAPLNSEASSELIVAKEGAGNTRYKNGAIVYTPRNGTQTSFELPPAAGTLATQEWVEEDYTVTMNVTTDGLEDNIAKKYTFIQNNQTIGTIDLAKELVVTSGDVYTVAIENTPYEGAVVGDKYIALTIANQSSPIYIPVKDLVDVYTANQSAEEVQIDISTNNVISASLTETVKTDITNGVTAYNWGNHADKGYVTASYQEDEGTLTLSSGEDIVGTVLESATINDLLDAKADNIPFNSTTITTHEVGGLASDSDLNGKSISWILTKLLGVINSVQSPKLTFGSSNTSLTISNPNNFPVTLWVTNNTCEIKYIPAGNPTPITAPGSYGPVSSGEDSIPAHGTKTVSVDISDYNLASIQSAYFSCYFTYKDQIESEIVSASK